MPPLQSGSWRLAADGEQAANAIGKLRLRRDQAQYQVSLLREIIKMAGVDEDALLRKQAEGKFFI